MKHCSTVILPMSKVTDIPDVPSEGAAYGRAVFFFSSSKDHDRTKTIPICQFPKSDFQVIKLKINAVESKIKRDGP